MTLPVGKAKIVHDTGTTMYSVQVRDRVVHLKAEPSSYIVWWTWAPQSKPRKYGQDDRIYDKSRYKNHTTAWNKFYQHVGRFIVRSLDEDSQR